MPRFASTKQLLLANGEWISGPLVPGASDYLNGVAKTDQAGVLHCEQSTDGINWDFDETAALVAGTGAKFSFQVVAPYIRLRYTNGGTNQGFFRLSSRFSSSGARP